jgi:hypothetical protein
MREERTDNVALLPATTWIQRELWREMQCVAYSSAFVCSMFLTGSLLLYFLTIR